MLHIIYIKKLKIKTKRYYYTPVRMASGIKHCQHYMLTGMWSNRTLINWLVQNYADGKKISGCQGPGIRRDKQAGHRGFLRQ